MPYIDMFKLMEYANNMADKTIDANDIARFPTADVQEVKHGEWIYHTDALPMSPYGHYECSECGQLIAHQENYCPKCGAKMDGKEKANEKD